MKKSFIFTISFCLIVLVGCKKEEKTDYTYTCLVGYWEPTSGSEYNEEVFNNSIHFSKSVSMKAANLEARKVCRRLYPNVDNNKIKSICRAYTDDNKAIVWMYLSLMSQHQPNVTTEAHQVRAADMKSSLRITHGCRAWVQTDQGSRKSIYHNSTAASHDLAVKEVRNIYIKKHPGTTNFESNCWPCDLSRLDEDGRLVCDRKSKRY